MARPMRTLRVLAADVGGSHVKALLSGETERRRFDSGPDLTPQAMVDGVLEVADGWPFERVSVGIPTPVRGGKPTGSRSAPTSVRATGSIERSSSLASPTPTAMGAIMRLSRAAASTGRVPAVSGV